MNFEMRLETLMVEARAALADMQMSDRTVAGIVDRVSALRYSEGRLVGFMDALALVDPAKAESVAQEIDGFISEAIAARILLG